MFPHCQYLSHLYFQRFKFPQISMVCCFHQNPNKNTKNIHNSPLTILWWTGFAILYLISRFLYAGILHNAWHNSQILDIFIYCIRGTGLNGVCICYLIRAWMYFVAYKNDHLILTNALKNSWVSNLKYRNTVLNEKWLLKMSMVLLLITALMLIFCRLEDISILAYIVYSIYLVFAVIILCIIPRAHDELQMRTEYIIFLVIYLVGLGVVSVVHLVFEHTTKRLITWTGGILLIMIGNVLSFYFPFIRADLWTVLLYFYIFIF